MTIPKIASAAAGPSEADWASTATRGGRVVAMVELADEPTAVVYARAREIAVTALSSAHSAEALAGRVAQEGLARVEQAQRALIPALEDREVGARVIYRVQRIFNGIAVEVEWSKLAAVRSLPGVRAVHPLPPMVPDNSTSVPWIGGPQVWHPSGPNATGSGVSIGIIDSGIDYIHRDFGGSGSYTGQTYDDNTVPWNAKVVGGTDLAGDSYDGDTTPVPDGDPMDCADNGHGTHVAGTAAGYGLTSTGAAFQGPYTADTDYFSFRIGPGVAPGAQLYAIKIFGCRGSTRLTSQGLEWAVDPNGDGDLSDHLDVVNLSLGSGFGSADYSSARAADNAVLAGVAVVASAGNNGDTYSITGSPGVAPRVISVANSRDDQYRQAFVTVISPSDVAGKYYASAALFGPPAPQAGITAAMTMASPANGCSALTNAGQMSGSIAIIDKPGCDYTVKVKNAQNAGAVAVVVANDTFGRVGMTGFDPTIVIPALMVSQSDGDKIKARLSNPGVTATFFILADGDIISTSSSRGPSRNSDRLKPDIAAPGYEITSARARQGTNSTVMSGTSMAAPHVTGGMALMRQLHPGWSVAELKALLMNTAANAYTGQSFGLPVETPSRVGAGRVDLATAAESPVIAFDADHPEQVSVSFEPLEVSDTATLSRTITVANKGASDETLAIAFAAASDIPGVEVSFPDGASVSVPAGGTGSFTVAVTATAAAMRHSQVPGLIATQDGEPRHWASEESGWVTLTPSTGPMLRVPMRIAARPVATLAATETSLTTGEGTGTTVLHLAGNGIATGTSYPEDIVSLLTPLELQYVGATYPESWGRSAALASVGVGSDYRARLAAGGGINDTTVLFGIATQKDWVTPNELGVEITLDTNLDGSDDYTLAFTDSATVDDADEAESDVFGAKLCPLPSETCTWVSNLNVFSAAERGTVVFHTNVMVLAVPAAALGLSEGAASFSYSVATAHLDADDVSTTPKLSYNVTSPGLSFQLAASPPVEAAGGTTLAVDWDRQALGALGSLGVLLLHHHNASGSRAQTLLVAAEQCALSCSTEVPDAAHSGNQVTFSASAEATGCQEQVSYAWELGGGATAEGQEVTHTYASPGEYAWRMTATSSGESCTASGVIKVDAPSPFRPPRLRLPTVPQTPARDVQGVR